VSRSLRRCPIDIVTLTVDQVRNVMCPLRLLEILLLRLLSFRAVPQD